MSAFFSDPVPGPPIVTVSSTTATTISLSWSVSTGSVVDSYEVMWESSTTRECLGRDFHIITISGGSNSHTITELVEGSSYTITVKASNATGSAVSDPVTGMTWEAGEGLTDMECIDNQAKSSLFIQLHLPHPPLLVHLM